MFPQCVILWEKASHLLKAKGRQGVALETDVAAIFEAIKAENKALGCENEPGCGWPEGTNRR